MRILVFSDSHGHLSAMEQAIRQQPQAKLLLFLGDGAAEAEAVRPLLAPDQTLLTVRGNNDWESKAPLSQVTEAENIRIFFTHGHYYHVKYGLYPAVCAARSQNAQILLFGHTHQPLADYDDGLYILNPGALCGSWESPPGYGTVDITPAGILLNHRRL